MFDSRGRMEYEMLLDVAASLKRLKMYPYFDVAHYILACMAVRDDSFSQQATGL